MTLKLGVEFTADAAPIKAAAGEATTAIAETGNAAKLSSAQLSALTRQGIDMATMWAQGTPPLQLFTSQIGTLYSTLASGPGGLSGGLKALAGTLMGLATPLGAVGVALTAAAGAAIYLGMSGRKEILPLDEMLKRHAETVRRLKDAYGEAASGVQEYAAESPKVAAFRAKGNLKELRESFLDGITDTGYSKSPTAKAALRTAVPKGLDQYYKLNLRFPSLTSVTEEAAAYREPLEKLLRGVRSQNPDVVRFQKSVTDIGEASSDQKVKDLGKALIDGTDIAANAQRAIEALDGSLKSLQDTLGGTGFGEAMAALEALRPDTRSAREKVEDAATEASQKAASYGEAVAAGNRRQEVLAAIDRQEAQEKGKESGGTKAPPAPDAAQAARSATARSAADALRASTDARARAGLSGYAAELAGINAQYRREIENAAGSAEAVRDLTRARELNIEALQIETRKSLFGAQEEELRALSVEASLIGATDEARRRALATLRAEESLRRAGIDLGSRGAANYLANTAALSDFAEAIRRQSEAWKAVQQSGEKAIDGLVDGLASGSTDIGAMLQGIAADVSKTFMQLAVANPLKNALLGTSYGTLDDLFADKPKAPSLASDGAFGPLGGSASNAMWVQFAGAGLGPESPIERRALAPLNDNAKTDSVLVRSPARAADAFDLTSVADPAVARTLRLHPERAAVAQYYADGALARGMDPEITLRGLNRESGFDLNARNLTNREQSYGVAQLNTMGGLGAVALRQGIDVRDNSTWREQADFALDTMRKDGHRQWYGFRDAGIGRWDGFDRTADSGGAAKAVTRLGETSRALAGNAAEFQANFASTLNDNLIGGMSSVVDQAVPGLGGVFGNLMRALESAFSGGGGLLSSLFGGGDLFGGISTGTVDKILGGAQGAFASGGYTGPGGRNEPAGIVHRGEVVWSQIDVARAGGVAAVEAMRLGRRGYADGGVVGMSGPAPGSARSAGSAGAPSVKIVDQRGANAPAIERRQSADEFGQPQLEMIIRDVVEDQVTRESSRTNRALRSSYGLSRQVIRR